MCFVTCLPPITHSLCSPDSHTLARNPTRAITHTHTLPFLLHRYLVVAIHSDIPFEEQMEAFEVHSDMVKIVVATNSAESSITLPDCDHVICLGSAKRMEYKLKEHRVQLVHRWISKASATQRAGRTARVRPGTVWRLYTENL